MSTPGGLPLHLPLARSDVDRDYLSRDRPELFDELWVDENTRVLAMFQGRVLITNNELVLMRVDAVPSAQYRVYLGRDSQGPLVLAVLTENAANLLQPEQSAWHQLRKTGAGLNDRDAGLFTQSLALANWHESHQYCPNCGTPTAIESGGWARRCFADGTEHFPRTDPAVIVSVVDENDRILLGSQGSWEDNRWSILAGFVEAGESLEAAVRREMFEEAGVRVDQVTYLGSQAWPFPRSLMVGFTAKALSVDFVPDGVEIERLRWFTREELAAQAKDLLLPNRVSIARSILEHWFGAELVSASELS